jgi:hypothetical protein
MTVLSHVWVQLPSSLMRDTRRKGSEVENQPSLLLSLLAENVTHSRSRVACFGSPFI